MEQRCETIINCLQQHGLYNNCEAHDDYVTIEVSWGDWKHSHGYIKQLVRKIYPHCNIETEITEEDGSDCYSAIHTITFNDFIKEIK